jgi:hypothetical protein
LPARLVAVAHDAGPYARAFRQLLVRDTESIEGHPLR